MTKILAQLCVYFGIVGVVVHAQSPLSPEQKEPLVEIITLVADLQKLEHELKGLNAEMDELQRQHDELDKVTPSRGKTLFYSLIGEDYDKETVERNRERMKELNQKYSAHYKRRIQLEQEILGKQLWIERIANSNRLPRDRVEAILRDKNLGSEPVVKASDK